MDEVILRMEHISKDYPGVKALDDVDLSLNRGEILAIVGENGAGKSTLMKVLSGSVRADKGAIWFDEKEGNFSNPRQALDAGISIMYQELNYLGELSIAENIFSGRLPVKKAFNKIDYKRLKKNAEVLLKKVNLKLDPFKPVKELSVAEKQLVEVAKAISRNVKILVMDEPTSALNDEETKNLFRIMREQTTMGTAIIYISHRLDEIFAISDRTLIMRDGRYVADVKTSDTTKEELVAMMVGRKIEDMYPQRDVQKGDVLLEVSGLMSKKIKDVRFTVREGEVVGLFGLMGAGRTEIAECIFGARKTISGTICVNGKRVSAKSPADSIKAGIAYVPAERKQDGLILCHTVKSNITLASLAKFTKGLSLKLSKENQAVNKWIEKLNIRSARVDTLVEALSGGNQQKVVLSKWLENEPKVLILNEPTRGIDVGAKVEIYKILEMLCKDKIGVLMISSELPEIMSIADRIIVIHEGRITGECDKTEVSQEKLLNMAIGG